MGLLADVGRAKLGNKVSETIFDIANIRAEQRRSKEFEMGQPAMQAGFDLQEARANLQKDAVMRKQQMNNTWQPVEKLTENMPPPQAEMMTKLLKASNSIDDNGLVQIGSFIAAGDQMLEDSDLRNKFGTSALNYFRQQKGVLQMQLAEAQQKGKEKDIEPLQQEIAKVDKQITMQANVMKTLDEGYDEWQDIVDSSMYKYMQAVGIASGKDYIAAQDPQNVEGRQKLMMAGMLAQRDYSNRGGKSDRSITSAERQEASLQEWLKKNPGKTRLDFETTRKKAMTKAELDAIMEWRNSGALPEGLTDNDIEQNMKKYPDKFPTKESVIEAYLERRKQ